MTLQEWMDARSLNDRQMAELVGDVTRSQVSRIRRQDSVPSIPLANRLSEVTGIPAPNFFPGLLTAAGREAA